MQAYPHSDHVLVNVAQRYVTLPSNYEATRAALSIACLVACCILSAFIARRRPVCDRSQWISIATSVVFMTSLLYIGISFIIIIISIGSSTSERTCDAASLWSIIGYYLGKFAIAAFLIERVHVVYSVGRVLRHRSRTYQVSLILWLCLLATAINAIRGRHSSINPENGACFIGLEPSASIPLLVVDVSTHLVLSIAFIVPLIRATFPRANGLAWKSCLASFVALVTTTANIAALIAHKGHAPSWIWLGTCSADLVINSIIIYMITSAAKGSNLSSDTARSDSVEKTTRSGFSSPRMASSFSSPSIQLEMPQRTAQIGLFSTEQGLAFSMTPRSRTSTSFSQPSYSFNPRDELDLIEEGIPPHMAYKD